MATLTRFAGPDWSRRSDRLALGPSELRHAIDALRSIVLPQIESDPAIALNVDLLATWFPNARFLYLYRDVREQLARMIDAWDRGTNPHPSNIQTSAGRTWCLNLPDGWSSVSHRDIPEIAAWQWSVSTKRALDALGALPAERWAIVSFDRLLVDDTSEFARLRDVLGLESRVMQKPFARAGERSPDATLWAPFNDRMRAALPLVAEQADRAVRLFALPPNTRAKPTA